jgi:hypothetical protein
VGGVEVPVRTPKEIAVALAQAAADGSANDLEARLTASLLLAAAGVPLKDIRAPMPPASPPANLIHFPKPTTTTRREAVMTMFAKATKKKARLRLTFDGPAGSGKTYSALLLAKHLGGRVALIDTEHGTASKYADLFDFDTSELQVFSLDNYLKAIEGAKAARYDVLIVDSLSHAWSGKGGALEEVDRVGGSNKFANGWRTVTPKHNQLIDALLAFPGHVICTLRTKMEYLIEDVNGKKVPRKVGMAPVQRDGVEYEFDVVADLSIDGNITITKTRCPSISGSAGLLKHADVPTMAETLKAWLSDGVEPPPPPTANENAEAKPAPVVQAAQPAQSKNGPPSAYEQVVIALNEAQNRADVDKLVARIKRLDPNDQNQIRVLYAAKLKEFRR